MVYSRPEALRFGVDFNRFRITPAQCTFKRQYAQVYASRLAITKSALIASACKLWGAIESNENEKQNISPKKQNNNTALLIQSLASINLGETCVIVGTLYKEMRLKPSILREITSADHLSGSGTTTSDVIEDATSTNVTWPAFRPAPRIISTDDQLYLEDEAQRILLNFTSTKKPIRGIGCLETDLLVTGIVVALLGRELEENPGHFQVDDVLFLEPQPERPIVALTKSPNSGKKWLALVSGLGFIGGNVLPRRYLGHAMALNLLGDWLREAGWRETSGHGDNEDDSEAIDDCLCLMILGDSIRTDNVMGALQANGQKLQQAHYLTRKAEAESVAAMAQLDAWLSSLPLGGANRPSGSGNDGNVDADVFGSFTASPDGDCGGGLCVHLVPGTSDVVSSLLPQQPMHAAVLPRAVAQAGGPGQPGLRGVSNPHVCRVAGRRVLASAGQAVQQVAAYTRLNDHLDCMESILHWGHLAPTCPDTLLGYPLQDCDPLQMRVQWTDSAPAITTTTTTTSKDKVGENEGRVVSPDYPDIYVSSSSAQAAAWRRASLLPWHPPAKSAETGGSGSGDSQVQEGALLVSVPRFDEFRCLVLVELASLECRVVRFNPDAFLDADDADKDGKGEGEEETFGSKDS